MLKILASVMVLTLSGCALFQPAPKPAEDYGYWQRFEIVKPVTIDVTEVRNMGAWCPQHPFAKGCASIEYAPLPLAGLPAGPLGARCNIYIDIRLPAEWKESVLEHEECHCRGFVHNVMKPGEGQRFGDAFDGWRPDKCPFPKDPAFQIIRHDPL